MAGTAKPGPPHPGLSRTVAGRTSQQGTTVTHTSGWTAIRAMTPSTHADQKKEIGQDGGGEGDPLRRHASAQ